MPKEIFMPKLSSTMEIGTLLQWFKEEGDSVEIGEPLFEIMTDKINIEVEAYDDGVFLKKYYEADDQIPVNAVIGYIGEANEQVPSEPPAQSEEASSEDSGTSSPSEPSVSTEVEPAVGESTRNTCSEKNGKRSPSSHSRSIWYRTKRQNSKTGCRSGPSDERGRPTRITTCRKSGCS